MLAKAKNKLRQLKEAYHAWLSTLLLPLATMQARWQLQNKPPLEILMDSSVLGHGVTHETGWISTGVKKWGHIDIDTGYMARIPVHAPDNHGRVYAEVRFLPAIAYLYKKSHIRLLTSAELFAEQFRQPMGRFQGYGWADHSVFEGMRFDSVDGLHMDVQNPGEK